MALGRAQDHGGPAAVVLGALGPQRSDTAASQGVLLQIDRHGLESRTFFFAVDFPSNESINGRTPVLTRAPAPPRPAATAGVVLVQAPASRWRRTRRRSS
jgi:hypothetical protein